MRSTKGEFCQRDRASCHDPNKRPLGPRAETGGKNGGGRLLCPWGVELGPIQRLFSAVRVFPGLSGFPRDRVRRGTWGLGSGMALSALKGLALNTNQGAGSIGPGPATEAVGRPQLELDD